MIYTFLIPSHDFERDKKNLVHQKNSNVMITNL